MALLFAAGVMNLFWMSINTVFVLVEKLTANGVNIGRIAGNILNIWGIVVILQGQF